MSYCRWSSDDFQCDVYVYEDCGGGWTTHAAERRHVYKEPLPPEIDISDTKAWLKRHRKVNKMLDAANLVDIGLSCDGMTFNDPNPGKCADRLEALRAEGYIVPQYAIDALRKEESDETR